MEARLKALESVSTAASKVKPLSNTTGGTELPALVPISGSGADAAINNALTTIVAQLNRILTGGN